MASCSQTGIYPYDHLLNLEAFIVLCQVGCLWVTDVGAGITEMLFSSEVTEVTSTVQNLDVIVEVTLIQSTRFTMVLITIARFFIMSL